MVNMNQDATWINPDSKDYPKIVKKSIASDVAIADLLTKPDVIIFNHKAEALGIGTSSFFLVCYFIWNYIITRKVIT